MHWSIEFDWLQQSVAKVAVKLGETSFGRSLFAVLRLAKYTTVDTLFAVLDIIDRGLRRSTRCRRVKDRLGLGSGFAGFALFIALLIADTFWHPFVSPHGVDLWLGLISLYCLPV